MGRGDGGDGGECIYIFILRERERSFVPPRVVCIKSGHVLSTCESYYGLVRTTSMVNEAVWGFLEILDMYAAPEVNFLTLQPSYTNAAALIP